MKEKSLRVTQDKHKMTYLSTRVSECLQGSMHEGSLCQTWTKIDKTFAWKRDHVHVKMRRNNYMWRLPSRCHMPWSCMNSSAHATCIPTTTTSMRFWKGVKKLLCSILPKCVPLTPLTVIQEAKSTEPNNMRINICCSVHVFNRNICIYMLMI